MTALVLRQVAYLNKAFWRNPAAAFFTFAFPLMFLVILNGVFGESQFFVPSIAAFSVVTACYTNIAISVTLARDEGILKRVRGTPLPGWVYLVARVLHAALIALLLVAIVAAFGALFYDVDLPTDTVGPLLVSVVVGAASFCALGLALTAVTPNADAAPPLANATILPLAFISDVFTPTDDLPDWLKLVGDIFPLKHFSEAMSTAFNPIATSSGWEPADLAFVVAWGAAGLALAVVKFRWEPRR